MNKDQLKLYVITDRSVLKNKSLKEAVTEAISGGATMVQLREKSLTGEELLKEALEIKEVCNTFKIPFIVNDDVYLAKQIDADGVHVGQSDMDIKMARAILGPEKIIGATAKTVEQAENAEQAGADYLGSGAVFGSTTKKDAKYMTKEMLQIIVKSVHIPVVAIGGINVNNALELTGTDIAGLAVISGVFGADDIEKEAVKLRNIYENSINNSRQ